MQCSTNSGILSLSPLSEPCSPLQSLGNTIHHNAPSLDSPCGTVSHQPRKCKAVPVDPDELAMPGTVTVIKSAKRKRQKTRNGK